MSLFGGSKKKKAAQSSAEKDSSEPAAIVPGERPPTFSEKDIASARKWFAQGNKLREDRNYDYAIESYLGGLKLWPEAVEEGHQPLRAAAFARRETGGKKPGTMVVMKHPMSGKDPVQAMINAERLWAHDPGNPAYMEGIIKNAAKSGFEKTVLYIGPILFDAAKNEKKISKDRFALLHTVYQVMGERCERRGDLAEAIKFYEGTVTVLQVLQQLSGASMKFTQELKNMSTKVTIIKGKYDSDTDFRSSLKDSEVQKNIHDRERMVMDEDRLEVLIDQARKNWADNPQVSAKLLALVELLCRGERADGEQEAMRLLDEQFQATGQYPFKQRADDLRMKQHRRAVREQAAAGDREALRQAQVEQLKFELRVFKERAAHYPTDNRIKYEYGWRLCRARMYDEAIPVLQEARNDPKGRIRCMNLIGRCFFEKGYHSQAIQTYGDAIAEYELGGDELSRELHYWLGRSCEAADRKEEALKAYGQLIQWDYNYRDVRDRLAALK